MDKKLRKFYGSKIDTSKDIELQRQSLFYELYFDLINITTKFIEAMAKKSVDVAMKDGNKLLKETLLKTINEIKIKSDEHKIVCDEILKSTQEKFSQNFI